ncbi:MAG: hypothetical protein M3380_02070 [Chloroflexota bacterium]|nr:hypothetical protein [Chloroflexota bacterium]
MARRLYGRQNGHTRAWLSPVLAFLVAALAFPLPGGAQHGPITVVVQVLTTVGEPVPDVVVKVTDAATNQPLAEGTTDQRGRARLTTMPPTEIRVHLTGRLADGTPLRHTRQDQRGIWVNLPHRDWMMELRVDTDGLIFPDLGLGNAGAPDASAVTAIAEGTLPTIFPTAPLATVVPRTAPGQTAVVEDPRSAQQAADALPAPAPVRQEASMALLLLLIGAIGSVIWLMARSRI